MEDARRQAVVLSVIERAPSRGVLSTRQAPAGVVVQAPFHFPDVFGVGKQVC